MKYDLMTVLTNFCVVGGKLYRCLAGGHVRPVQLVDRGRLLSVIGTSKFFGPDVAYMVHHRVVPMYPIVQLDGDPHNVAEENLMPVRLTRLRYRLTKTAGGWKQPLDAVPYNTEEEARAAWLILARHYYLKDKSRVRLLEDEMAGVKPEVPKYVPVAPRKTYPKGEVRLVPPNAVAGRKWHWWGGSWLSLPEAVHCSDDWQVRAEAYEANPDVRFVYDPLSDRTLRVS